MRSFLLFTVLLITTPSVFCQSILSDTTRIKNNRLHKKGNDHADLAMEFEISRTKDPLTGKVPRALLADANRAAKSSQEEIQRKVLLSRTNHFLNWAERGSYTDIVGPSNGNTRSNAAVNSGRIRAVWADLSDQSGNTVWVGGVDGGIWKTLNITHSPATWNIVNDYLSNLAVTGICQDPTNTNVMYFCTGEAFFNADAVNGNGVYKSADGGVNWWQLSSTANFTACSKILCDAAGNIYLATIGNGMRRSTNGGITWTDITPVGLSNRIADFEISSTGRMHISCGLHTSLNGYRYIDDPSTVNSATWISANTPFFFPKGNNSRVEIACSGNVLYAAMSNVNAIVDSVSKSADGGVSWSTTALTTNAKESLNGNGTTSQAWYCLTVGINPANTDQAMIGNLNLIKTINGGNTWSQVSEWAGSSGQFVHADQHAIVWYNNGNRLLLCSDGGIYFSADSGKTIRDRNVNLRLKQLYSVAIHPTSTDYFLAGTQDNGVHQFNRSGLSESVEVTGGDGGYVAIDQNQPNFQFGTYVYNSYRRSTNNGNTWSMIDFYKGTPSVPGVFGSFINAYAYDNNTNTIYAGAGGGELFRWTNSTATPPGTYYQSTNWPSEAIIISGITSLGSNKISAISISPYLPNRIYIGTENGKVITIDSAHNVTSNITGNNITGPSFAGTVSSVNTGKDDQHLIVSFSNYNTTNIWISTNGGNTWTGIDGNLPNMPVRWAIFYPNTNTKAIIATEAGIWETEAISGNNTVWTANPTFPVVRTDMLQYRSVDGLLAAATHGRGLFTTNIPVCNNNPVISLQASQTNYCYGMEPVSLIASGGDTYTWSPPLGLSATTGATVNATPSSITTYVVNGYDSLGCSASESITINLSPGVMVYASANPTTVCNNGTSVLAATAHLQTPEYCIPVYNGNTGSHYISQVSSPNTTLNSLSGASSSPYFTLFPSSGNTTADFYTGVNYYLVLKAVSQTSAYIRAWIDFNQDGIFSQNETIGITSNAAATSAYIYFNIPTTAYSGTTRLRLRSGTIFQGARAYEACGEINSNAGETEDYIIHILNGANPFSYTWAPSAYLSSAYTNPTHVNSINDSTQFFVKATSGYCAATTSVTVQSCPANLQLKLFLEGYYTGNSAMRTTLFDLGMNASAISVDTITVQLWSPQALNNPSPSFSQKVILQKNGLASVEFPAGVKGNTYYLAIQQRNHLETWSALPVTFFSNTSYDFSTGTHMAYGDGVNPSMKNLGGNVFGFYGGDSNNDGSVDGSDLSMVENGAIAFEFGYNANDITGDGATDGSDLSIIETNAQHFLFYASPW